ncbi:MAG: hypothetical protein HUJ70_08160 [Pseudobutyrivibrio sp.]|nr:hypothetical protein [Pseudobutyrivibrio sp.]
MSLTINSNNFNAISTLFSGLSTGQTSSSTGLESMLGDYYSIKSGSYSKLMNSFYNTYGKEGFEELGNKVDASADTKELNVIRNDAKAVKEASDKLLDTGKNSLFNKVEITAEDGTKSMDYDREKIYSAVKDYVDAYNDLVDSGQEANATNVLTQLAGMVTTSAASSKTLASVGITIDSDNKLSINEETFKKASMSTVQDLFNNKGGYLYRTSTKASMIDSLASSQLSSITGQKSYTSGGNYNLSMSDVLNQFNTTT